MVGGGDMRGSAFARSRERVMDDDLLQLLRSRDVPRDDIMWLGRDKVGSSVVSVFVLETEITRKNFCEIWRHLAPRVPLEAPYY